MGRYASSAIQPVIIENNKTFYADKSCIGRKFEGKRFDGEGATASGIIRVISENGLHIEQPDGTVVLVWFGGGRFLDTLDQKKPEKS